MSSCTTVQRRLSAALLCPDIGPLLGEQLRYRLVPVRGHPVQRRPSTALLRIDVGPLLDEQPRYRLVPVRGRPVSIRRLGSLEHLGLVKLNSSAWQLSWSKIQHLRRFTER